MTEGRPLQPLGQPVVISSTTRRKSRVCTREACECCREKKAKCNGETPCSRCISRRLRCNYRVKASKTKRKLQEELNELKEAQRKRESLIQALAAPESGSEVLMRLWNGESIADITEALSTVNHGNSLAEYPPANDSQPVTPELAGRTFSGPLPPPVIPAVQSESPQPQFTSSNVFNQPSTGHIRDATGGKDMSEMSPKGTDLSMMPTFSTRVFERGSSMTHAPDDLSPTSFDVSPQNEAPPMGNQYTDTYHNDHYYSQPYSTDDMGAVNWWTPIPHFHEAPFSNTYGPTHPSDMMNNQNHMSGQIPPVSTGSAPSTVQSPTTISSSPGIGQPSCHRPSISSNATGSGLAVQPPHLPPDHLPSPAGTILPTPPLSADVLMPDAEPASTRSAWPPSQPPPAQPPARPAQSKDRHRQASARNWQKQKQQAVELQAIKNEVETRHRYLKAEYNDLLGQVVAVKSRLMDHARCDHPAIGSWLRSQATNYVLAGGPRKDRVQQHHRPSSSSSSSVGAVPPVPRRRGTVYG
ncbi:Conidial development protein fluffy [Colletotrichum trifolii]|uniref:Conidial development protein fluffy n=1 Tax=Colletotrichum trifolii TaxID=5466 RepID=A0A4R8QPT1_COLTR|nr:Conidial development protein fluffy [Colletotrichum trifolii]